MGSKLLVELTDINTAPPDSRIHVPESYREEPLFGIVRGVGGRCEEFNGQVGDTVLFDMFSGNKIEGFPNMLIIHEKNILAIYYAKTV